MQAKANVVAAATVAVASNVTAAAATVDIFSVVDVVEFIVAAVKNDVTNTDVATDRVAAVLAGVVAVFVIVVESVVVVVGSEVIPVRHLLVQFLLKIII